MITNKENVDLPVKFAQSLYNEFYFMLYNSDSDKGQEVLVSILARQCTELAIKHILSEVSPDITRLDRNGLTQVEFFELAHKYITDDKRK